MDWKKNFLQTHKIYINIYFTRNAQQRVKLVYIYIFYEIVKFSYVTKYAIMYVCWVYKRYI